MSETPAPYAHARDRQIGGDHYARMTIQPMEFAHANGLGFAEGLALKYLCRHRHKHGRQDLDKAIHVIEVLRDLEYPLDTTGSSV